MIYRLLSEDLNVPNQVIEDGETLVLGRNRECKIKNLKCPRNYCTVKAEGSKLLVQYTKSDDCQYFKSNQVISGPGFSYRIKIVDTEPQRLDAEDRESATRECLNWIDLVYLIDSYSTFLH